MTYDSSADTLKHIRRVNQLLLECCQMFIQRAAVHDESKLHSPEKEVFDEFTPRLAGLTYGSEEYRECLKQMERAIKQHQLHNSHHPEYYTDGMDGMDLMDLVEMLCDWKAATERHNDGDLGRSLCINRERFGISDQLHNVLCNSAMRWFGTPPPASEEEG